MTKLKPRVLLLLLAASFSPGIAFADDSILAPSHYMMQINPKIVQVDTPGPNTAGLVVLGNTFVACYQEGNEAVITRRVNDDSWIELVRFEGLPGPLAWDGDHLWVVDLRRSVIVRYGSLKKNASRTHEIPIPPAAIRTPPAITGLTWDGEALWLVTDCGLCSTLFRIEPETGNVLQAVFPKCMARGLAYRPGSNSATGELLMAAFIGRDANSLLLFRDVASDGETSADSLEFFRFRSIGQDTPDPQDPTSIAVQEERVWVVDRQSDNITAYKLPFTRVRFDGINFMKVP